MSLKYPNNSSAIADTLTRATEFALIDGLITCSATTVEGVAVAFFRRYSVLVWAAAFLVLLPILAACGGGTRDNKSAPRIAENPLTVSVQAVAAQQVSQTIGPEGGTLKATGADGARFILEIPKDAIARDTVVTMTPVAAIEGLPLNKGLVGAVQFGPDGLRLLQPALLTIEPTQPVPVPEQVGFAYAGTGQDFHLAPLALRTDMIQLYVLNFSGAGVGQGSTGDAATVIPASPLARLQQKTAEAIQRDREQGSDTLSAETIKIIKDALAEYQAHLDPLMKRAEKDCALAHQVVPEQIALERQRELLGLSSGQGGTWQVSAAKAVDNCLEEAMEELRTLCREGASQAKLEDAAARVISYERLRQLLGSADETSSRLTEVSELLKDCKPKGWSGTITITENRNSSSGGWDSSSRSQATITIEGGTGRWEAQGSGSSAATNLTRGCAKQDSTEYSGRGPAVLNVGGSGAATGGSDSARPPALEGEVVAADVTVDSDGSYSLRFSLQLKGTWHRVGTGNPGPPERCEVYDRTEEGGTTIGVSVTGKGPARPDRLAGTDTKPIENIGKKIGEQTVTWDLVRR